MKNIVLTSIAVTIILLIAGCSSTPKGESDNITRPLDKQICTIKDGIPFAKERVNEWGKKAALKYINASFEGKEQIENKKGNIYYFFSAIKDDKNNLPANADVRIDMNENSIANFSVSYDPRYENIDDDEKQILLEDLKGINVDEWKIDINESFDIATRELGENKVFEYENPKVVLRCSKSFWDFAVYSTPDAPAEDLLVVINPETGKVIRVEDKTKKYSSDEKK